MSRIVTISSIIKTHLNSPLMCVSGHRYHKFIVGSFCRERAEANINDNIFPCASRNYYCLFICELGHHFLLIYAQRPEKE